MLLLAGALASADAASEEAAVDATTGAETFEVADPVPDEDAAPSPPISFPSSAMKSDNVES